MEINLRQLMYSTILLLIVSFTFACERATQLIIISTNPPQFRMSGSGTMGMLRMHGPKVRDVPGEAAYIVWEIVPEKGRLNGKRIEQLVSITYGEVPEGYVQTYPEQGGPPSIIEGAQYDIFIDTLGANGKTKYFTVQDNKIVENPETGNN